MLVGFVWPDDESCSSLVQFVQFIFEVVWSSSSKRNCYVSVQVSFAYLTFSIDSFSLQQFFHHVFLNYVTTWHRLVDVT